MDWETVLTLSGNTADKSHNGGALQWKKLSFSLLSSRKVHSLLAERVKSIGKVQRTFCCMNFVPLCIYSMGNIKLQSRSLQLGEGISAGCAMLSSLAKKI